MTATRKRVCEKEINPQHRPMFMIKQSSSVNFIG